MLDIPPEVTEFPALHSNESAEQFLEISDKLTDQRYWEVLRWVWIAHGGSISRLQAQEQLLFGQRQMKEHFMSPNERKAFATLPEELEVFHGTSLDAVQFGWSWAMKFHNSDTFARKRFTAGMKVVRGKCLKKDVLAYFADYDENEIVIRPSDVQVVEQFVGDNLFDARRQYGFD